VQTTESIETYANVRRRRARCLLQSSAAIVLGNLIAAFGALAQTTLHDINVIATTPLSGTRSPQRSVAPAAPSRPARATRAAPARPGRATAVRIAPAAPAVQASVPADSSMIDRDKVPANTRVLTSADFSHDRSTSFLDGLSQSLPGVFISDQSGNQFQRDVNYRGFVASPVQGTPQGLAVYQNGVRGRFRTGANGPGARDTGRCRGPPREGGDQALQCLP
jgi:iron complex outermembrane recepter protein